MQQDSKSPSAFINCPKFRHAPQPQAYLDLPIQWANSLHAKCILQSAVETNPIASGNITSIPLQETYYSKSGCKASMTMHMYCKTQNSSLQVHSRPDADIKVMMPLSNLLLDHCSSMLLGNNIWRLERMINMKQGKAASDSQQNILKACLAWANQAQSSQSQCAAGSWSGLDCKSST